MSVTIARIYLSEADGLLQTVVSKLHDDEKVMGLTVFRGICGFGRSGRIHSSTLLDLSSDLPLVVEFFDETDKVESIIDHVTPLVGPGHIVSWPAKVAG